MAGQIIQNQTLSGTITDADANTYINCLFTEGTIITGDGIVFVNCVFEGNCADSNLIYVLGTGSVLSGGASYCTVFGVATVVGYTHVFASVAGPFSNIYGGMYTQNAPVVDTTCPASQETGGSSPPTVRQFCWSQDKTDDIASDTGSRT